MFLTFTAHNFEHLSFQYIVFVEKSVCVFKVGQARQGTAGKISYQK